MCTQVKGPPSEFDPQCGYHILYQSCYLPSLLKAAQERDPYERCRGRWRRLTTPSPWVPSLSFSFSRSRSSSESSAQQRVRRGEKGSGKRVVHSGFKASLASPLLVPSLLSFSPPSEHMTRLTTQPFVCGSFGRSHTYHLRYECVIL